MPKIEICVDVGGSDLRTHTFIMVTGPDGVTRGYGFGPKHEGWWIDVGKVYDDTKHEKQITSGEINISDEQYAKLMKYISQTDTRPGSFDLLSGRQCTNWVLMGLHEAGITGVMAPDPFFRTFFDTIAFNPYTQFAGFWFNNLINQATKLSSTYASAATVRRRDPLLVDLDGDGDGYSSADELFTISELGIASININYTSTNVTDADGNTLVQQSTFTKTDSSTGQIGGFNLQRDTTYTIADEWLDVSETIAALPDLQGYGNVYDLHQAMMRDTTGQLQWGNEL